MIRSTQMTAHKEARRGIRPSDTALRRFSAACFVLCRRTMIGGQWVVFSLMVKGANTDRSVEGAVKIPAARDRGWGEQGGRGARQPHGV